MAVLGRSNDGRLGVADDGAGERNDVQELARSGAATEGAQAIFGRVYQVHEFGREDPSYDGVRDLALLWQIWLKAACEQHLTLRAS